MRAAAVLLLALVAVWPRPAGAESLFADPFETAETLRLSSYYDRAAEIYTKLAADKAHPRRREILLGLGECHLMRDRVDDLFALAATAVEDYPDSALAHAGLGLAWAAKARRSRRFFRTLGPAAEASACVSRALRLDPDCALAWFVRGLLHFHMSRWQGNLPEAGRDFKRAIASFDPFASRVRRASYWHLALTHRRLRENRQATLVLERAARLYPDDRRFRDLLDRARRDAERYPR